MGRLLTHGMPTNLHGVPTNLLRVPFRKESAPFKSFWPGNFACFLLFSLVFLSLLDPFLPCFCPVFTLFLLVFALFLGHFGVFVPQWHIHTLNHLFLRPRSDLQNGKTPKKGQKRPPLQGNRTVFGIYLARGTIFRVFCLLRTT